MMNWPRRISIAVLACAIANVFLVVALLVGIVQVQNAIHDQGHVLAVQQQQLEVSACAQTYSAVSDAWGREATRRYGRFLAQASAGHLSLQTVVDYREAAGKAATMARLRLGLAQIVVDANFTCPPLPPRLRIAPIPLRIPAPVTEPA